MDVGERASQLAVGEDAVWVAGGSTVWRFDPATNAVTSTVVDVLADQIATGEGAVWGTGRGALSRINPDTGRVTGTVHLGSPRGLAVGHGKVWVADSAEGGVLRRISPQDLRVEATVKVPGLPDDTLELPEEPGPVAVGEGGVWVAGGVRGHMSRLDPGKNTFNLTMSRLGLQTWPSARGRCG